jgi:hypothetical protein
MTRHRSFHGPRRGRARICALALTMSMASLPASAQEARRVFVGGLFGVSTLSADGRSVTTGTDAALSLYKPENGLALNLFAGVHLAEYFSIQANWMWNRNDVTLVSSLVAPQGGGFYEQRRHTHQHAVVFDGLIYFRPVSSVVRPYLGTGISLVRFTAGDIANVRVQGLAPPTGDVTSTRIGLRSHVGIDVRLSRRVRFRYSFSETISGNPISVRLTPPGERNLANFQNLFGIIRRF